MADTSVRSPEGFTVSRRKDKFLGTTLAGYRIDEKLAEGGFGAVYRAKHLASAARVALKVLHPHFARDPNMTARFQREAATMSRLSNPHTVRTHATGEADDGTLYIAMELLVGECLHERITRGPLPWRNVITIARSICDSLAEAHGLGVVHRDLKPANIFLSEGSDFVKVLDFGIVEVRGSRVLDDGEDLTRTGMTVGTLDYMSPEQITEKPCDGRSDLYSLGVLMYEALTGRRPFAGLGGPQLLAAMLTQVPERPSTRADVPVELDRIVMTCLRRDAKERFADVRALDHALAAALATLVPGRVEQDDEETTWCNKDALRSAPVLPVASTHGASSAAVTPRARPVPASVRPSHASMSAAAENVVVRPSYVAISHATGLGVAATEPVTPAASSMATLRHKTPAPELLMTQPEIVLPVARESAPMHPAYSSRPPGTIAALPPPPVPAMGFPMAVNAVHLPPVAALPPQRAARGSVAQLGEPSAMAVWAQSMFPMVPAERPVMAPPAPVFEHTRRQDRDRALARMALLAALSVSAAVVALLTHFL